MKDVLPWALLLALLLLARRKETVSTTFSPGAPFTWEDYLIATGWNV
jgi:hypothetical protein